jgi:hypothetical protein
MEFRFVNGPPITPNPNRMLKAIPAIPSKIHNANANMLHHPFSSSSNWESSPRMGTAVFYFELENILEYCGR